MMSVETMVNIVENTMKTIMKEAETMLNVTDPVQACQQ